jgi:hypothetical protein
MNSAKKILLLLSISLLTLSATAEIELNSEKYITIDEVETSMSAYCLTVYKGTKVEKFPLEVISVVRNYEPGHNAILVKGTSERFIHTGPVAGCSGSPVFIDGKLAGALAFGWSYSKDPLYGVTPIKEMLQAGEINAFGDTEHQGYYFDLTKPINLERVSKKILNTDFSFKTRSGLKALPTPVSVSGLSEKGLEQFNKGFEDAGLFAVSGSPRKNSAQPVNPNDVKLERGSILSVPLVSGDVSLAVTGTVTEVTDDKVYGFGHSFLGYGNVDLPMATGQVHTVVSTLPRSFKLSSPLKTVGSLQADQATAVVGEIGRDAQQIPLNVTIDRYNDPEGIKKYECLMAVNRTLSPNLLAAVLVGTITKQGDLGPYGSIGYDVKMNFEGLDPIKFNNIIPESRMSTFISEAMSSLGLLMNNSYKKVRPESIDINVRITDNDMRGRIWSATASKTEVERGENIKLDVIIEKARSGKKKYSFIFKVPRQLKPGNYKMIVCGADYYENFLSKMASQKLLAENLKTLVEALNYSLSVDNTKLYCMFVLPPEGITIERAELPDLPGTKSMVLADAKRTLGVKPFNKWLEKKIDTDTVIQGNKTLKITVKK